MFLQPSIGSDLAMVTRSEGGGVTLLHIHHTEAVSATTSQEEVIVDEPLALNGMVQNFRCLSFCFDAVRNHNLSVTMRACLSAAALWHFFPSLPGVFFSSE